MLFGCYLWLAYTNTATKADSCNKIPEACERSGGLQSLLEGRLENP
jgi:hypothetical protein